VPGAAQAEVDAPRARDEHAAVAIGAQRLALVEMDDRGLRARAAEPDPAERELALLRLEEGDQRPRLVVDAHLGIEAEHGPDAGDPWSRRDHDRLARHPALARRDRLDAGVAELEADDLRALADV